MNLVKNLFMVIGLVLTAGILYAYVAFDLGTRIDQVKKLDPKAKAVYSTMMDVLLTTGDIAKATVRKVKIDDDVSNEDVVEALNSIATERSMKAVGDLPLSDEVEARTGKKQRYTRVLSYCSPSIAMEMVSYSMAYGAYLPCRLVIMEDDKGDRWIYTLDLDMMIHGGYELPTDMLAYGNKVKKTIYDMMDLAAKGEF
ncbi:MAG TPA: DUF302 domain-containing protein [Arcobacter sp.]|nr:DUF302 domain-containing protein [Arcobacter sp.]